jgi:hypothetical protein
VPSGNTHTHPTLATSPTTAVAAMPAPPSSASAASKKKRKKKGKGRAVPTEPLPEHEHEHEHDHEPYDHDPYLRAYAADLDRAATAAEEWHSRPLAEGYARQADGEDILIVELTDDEEDSQLAQSGSRNPSLSPGAEEDEEHEYEYEPGSPRDVLAQAQLGFHPPDEHAYSQQGPTYQSHSHPASAHPHPHPHGPLPAIPITYTGPGAYSTILQSNGLPTGANTNGNGTSHPHSHPHSHPQSLGSESAARLNATAAAQAELLATANDLYRRMDADPQGGIADDDEYWASLPGHIRSFVSYLFSHCLKPKRSTQDSDSDSIHHRHKRCTPSPSRWSSPGPV